MHLALHFSNTGFNCKVTTTTKTKPTTKMEIMTNYYVAGTWCFTCIHSSQIWQNISRSYNTLLKLAGAEINKPFFFFSWGLESQSCCPTCPLLMEWRFVLIKQENASFHKGRTEGIVLCASKKACFNKNPFIIPAFICCFPKLLLVIKGL